MKKKTILLIILCIAIVVAIIIIGLIVAKNVDSANLDEVKLIDKVEGVETTIKYPKDVGIVAKYEEEDALPIPEVTLTNEKHNYIIEFKYEKTSKYKLEEDKKNIMKKETSNCKDVSYSGYKGFQYDDDYYNGKQIILTTNQDNKNKNEDTIVALNILARPLKINYDNGDRVNFDQIFKRKEIKTILNNISINENIEKVNVTTTISNDKTLIVNKFEEPEGYILQQTGDANGVTSIYLDKSKGYISSAEVRVELCDNPDNYKNAEEAANYYSTDGKKYEKVEHNGMIFYVYEDPNMHSQDIYFDKEDGHILHITYSLHKDISEDIGNLLIDNVIKNVHAYNN